MRVVDFFELIVKNKRTLANNVIGTKNRTHTCSHHFFGFRIVWVFVWMIFES